MITRYALPRNINKMESGKPSTKNHLHHSSDDSHGEKGEADKCCEGHGTSDTPKPLDIFQCVKVGFLSGVQQLVEEEGPAVLVDFDDKGHTPVHWATLGGHTNILRFMVQCKVNLDLQSRNDLGPRPIHWACVNGHIAICDILLQAGVSIDTVDNKGCSPLIIACQYGQTMLAGYLMGKGARLQLTDREGDNALHWAAFKGHCDLTRLLIYSGFNPRQKDNFGQTPLHLACINGDLNTVRMLCEQDGVEIDIEDHNHKTPVMLAKGRKHKDITSYLEKEIKQQKSIIPRIDCKTILFGPPGNSKAAFLFFVISTVFWGYPMYIFRCFPATFGMLPGLHIVFILNNVFMWYTFYNCYTRDPGFLPRNSADYDMAIKKVAHFDEWKQGRNPLSKLCHTCRLVKPLRTKHCRVCNRCVIEFDHHCPYIYNCVGLKNRYYFAGFTTSAALMACITLYFAVVLIKLEGWNALYGFGLLEAIFFGFVANMLCTCAWYMAAKNTNTNERINFARYDYLKDAQGHYYNPYDRGILNNMKEFFHLKPTLSEDEVLRARTYTV